MSDNQGDHAAISDEMTLYHRYEVEKMLRRARADALAEAAKVVKKRGEQLLRIGTTPKREKWLKEYCDAYKDAARCIECLAKVKL